MTKKMLRGLEGELHKFQNNSIVVDLNGESASTLKFYDSFDSYIDESGNNMLVLTGETTEDAVYVPVNKIRGFYPDPISDTLLISAKGMDISIYQQ